MKILTTLLFFLIFTASFSMDKIDRFVYIENDKVVDKIDNPNAFIDINNGIIKVFNDGELYFKYNVASNKENGYFFFCNGYFKYAGEEPFVAYLAINLQPNYKCYDFIISKDYRLLIYTK